MKKLFNMKRVDQTAEIIAAALAKLLNRHNAESPLSRCIRQSQAYKSGLTNGERVLATIRALSMIQNGTVVELASLTYSHEDEDDEAA
jgi:hypothetical protein